MQNSMGIQDYMSDLNSWMSDMNKNEKVVTEKAKQVRLLFYLFGTFGMF